MTVTVILNGLPKKKKKFYARIHPVLKKSFSLDIRETKHASHAKEIAEAVVSEKVPVILVAGGDGTLSQVVNGIMNRAPSPMPILGLIPLGSANDFAKTCGLPLKPEPLITLLSKLKPIPTDLGRIQCQSDQSGAITHFFINECSVGMGPEVVKRLLKTGKNLGPSLSYLVSILSTFISHQPQEVQCKSDNWEWKGKVRVLAAANGQSFGDSTYIAPDAKTDDGWLNTFIAGDLPLMKFLTFLQTIKGKKKINHPLIQYNLTKRMHWSSDKPCWLEADGELVGVLPATIEVLPQKINFLR